MYRFYLIAVAAVGSMCLAAAFIMPRETAETPIALATSKPVPRGESDALLLRRDHSGQFHLDADVDGIGVNFLVDTGADIVALTEDEAAELNLNVSPGDFEPVMQTASGVGYGAPVKLDQIEVAGTTLRNVDAVVVRGLSVNLLGQSVLRKLGAVELRGDSMVIRAR